MARREYARIGTDMPDEPSVRACTVEELWLYDHALYLRPEMSRCGVIPLRPTVWAELATNATEAKCRKWLRGLEKRRMVVVDERYSEVFVRTYVRWDGLLGQPNVVANMVADYRVIASPLIRAAVLTELRRLWDLDDLTDGARGGWQLAMGHYPQPKTDRGQQWPSHIEASTLARLRKSIGLGLAPDMTEHIAKGFADPFTEGFGGGIPEPFTQTPGRTPYAGGRAGAIAVSAVTGSDSGPGSGSERRTPEPPGGGIDAAVPAGQQHTHPADALLDQAGPFVPRIRDVLRPIVTELIDGGIPHQAITGGLATWKTRRAGPRLLVHLVQDQLTPAQQADPRFAGLLDDARSSA